MEHEFGHGIFQAFTQRLPHHYAVRLLMVLGLGAFSLWARAMFPRLAAKAAAVAEGAATAKLMLLGALNLALLLGISFWLFRSAAGHRGRFPALLLLALSGVVLLVGSIPVITLLGRTVLAATARDPTWAESTLIATAAGALILGFLANVPLVGGVILVLCLCQSFGVGWLTVLRVLLSKHR